MFINRPTIFRIISLVLVCTFLVNDLSWRTGDDYNVAPGKSITLTPSF